MRSLLLVGTLVWLVGCDLGIQIGDPLDGRVDKEDIDPAPDNGGGGTGENGGGDAGTTATFEPFTIATRGLRTTSQNELIVGATAAANPVGCALFTNEEANPGQATSLIFAKFDLPNWSYCPQGSYAINSASNLCDQVIYEGIREDCAVYKRWDATGTQVATLYAVGGGVTVTAENLGNGSSSCVVNLHLLFPGGASWSDSYAIDYPTDRSGPNCLQTTPNP